MNSSGKPANSYGLQVDLGLEEHDLEKRLKYLGLTEDDAKRLQTLIPVFRESVAGMVDTFYQHLLSFDETSRFLQEPELVERLKQAQKEHFFSTLEAQWNDEYVSCRRRVGAVHADRGIEPMFFLGAYYQFIENLVGQLWNSEQDNENRNPDQLLSLFKVMFLDIGLTLESYFTKLTVDLRQALEMVWTANNDLRHFARLASHDLKTPLATVANLCDEALDEFHDEIPAEARELISAARQTAFRMSTTIDELLSATISTEAEGMLDEISSEDVIHEALERVRRDLDKKGIEVRYSGTMPRVLGNKAQLREAFYNLFSNAAKYVDNAQGVIEVHVESRDKDYVFSVSDNGPGIPPDEIERVFSPFHRLPAHRSQPGSGLGLYFAKTLVEHQGGRLWAESQLGKGSRFFVLLKAAPTEEI